MRRPLTPRATVLLVVTAVGPAACASRPLARAPLTPDRPGYGNGPAIAAPGAPVLETGYAFSRSGSLATHAVGEVLLRASPGGMAAGRAELRLGLNSYALAHAAPGPRQAAHHAVGREDASVGVKLLLHEKSAARSPWHPTVSAIATTTLPTGDVAFRSVRAQPEATLIVQWDPTARVSIGVNAAHASASDVRDDGEPARFGRTTVSGAASLQLTARLGAFLQGVDVRVPRAVGRPTRFAGAGLTYLVGSDLQLDVHAAAGMNHFAPDYQLGLGAARRF